MAKCNACKLAKLHTGTCGSKIRLVFLRPTIIIPFICLMLQLLKRMGVLASQSPLCWLMLLLHFAETNGSWQSSPFVCLLMLLHFAETNGSWHAGPKPHWIATSHDDVEICAGFLWSLTCRSNKGKTGNAQQQGYQVHSWTNNSSSIYSSSVVRLFVATELPCAQDSPFHSPLSESWHASQVSITSERIVGCWENSILTNLGVSCSNSASDLKSSL